MSKAIMISIKPKWCAEIMNGNKTIEVRKNKVLATAIQKLIDEYGYADIYVYCSKDKAYSKLCKYPCDNNTKAFLNLGKVLFKFRCYKIDEYVNGRKWSWKSGSTMWGACNDYEYILKDTCLTDDELRNYADDLSFIAIHISDLEIFDYPKELCEFHTNVKKEPPEELLCPECGKPMEYYEYKYLTKAPQNFCYVEEN